MRINFHFIWLGGLPGLSFSITLFFLLLFHCFFFSLPNSQTSPGHQYLLEWCSGGGGGVYKEHHGLITSTCSRCSSQWGLEMRGSVWSLIRFDVAHITRLPSVNSPSLSGAPRSLTCSWRRGSMNAFPLHPKQTSQRSGSHVCWISVSSGLFSLAAQSGWISGVNQEILRNSQKDKESKKHAVTISNKADVIQQGVFCKQSCN